MSDAARLPPIMRRGRSPSPRPRRPHAASVTSVTSNQSRDNLAPPDHQPHAQTDRSSLHSTGSFRLGESDEGKILVY